MGPVEVLPQGSHDGFATVRGHPVRLVSEHPTKPYPIPSGVIDGSIKHICPMAVLDTHQCGSNAMFVTKKAMGGGTENKRTEVAQYVCNGREFEDNLACSCYSADKEGSEWNQKYKKAYSTVVSGPGGRTIGDVLWTQGSKACWYKPCEGVGRLIGSEQAASNCPNQCVQLITGYATNLRNIQQEGAEAVSLEQQCSFPPIRSNLEVVSEAEGSKQDSTPRDHPWLRLVMTAGVIAGILLVVFHIVKKNRTLTSYYTQ